MAGQCETISAQRFQSGRRDNRRGWKWRRAKSGRRRNQASDSEYPIRDERPAPGKERAEGPRRCLLANRSWVKRVRARFRRTLSSKLSCRSEVNNGTGGQRRSFLLANPVASMRLEQLLVRSTRSNPVRKNRAWRIWLSPAMVQVVPGEPLGMEKAYFAREWGSARMRSLVLRYSSRKPKPK